MIQSIIVNRVKMSENDEVLDSKKRTYNFKNKGNFIACRPAISHSYLVDNISINYYCFCQTENHKYFNNPRDATIMNNTATECIKLMIPDKLCQFTTLQDLMVKYFEINPNNVYVMDNYSIYSISDDVTWICEFEDIIPVYINYLQKDNMRLRKKSRLRISIILSSRWTGSTRSERRF